MYSQTQINTTQAISINVLLFSSLGLLYPLLHAQHHYTLT